MTDTPPLRLMIDPIYAAYAENIGGLPADIQVAVVDDAAVWNALPADLGGQYDAAIALGDYPAMDASSAEVAWELLLNANLAPLDQPEIRDIFGAALTPNADPAPLRIALANAGYPDGLLLSAVQSAPPPLSDAMISALANIGVDLHAESLSLDAASARISANRAHLALLARPVSASEPDAIRYAARPIRFRAAAGIEVDFTPDGLPIVSRS
ncbi:MAG: hypothetical protein SGI73_02860 [Chloroflexota bacterium]|nr:hypothetical protein [Chloroflexota bacterium]